MTKPRLLDLFCGAGGAAMGYHQAGFDVVGVDIAPQRHFPFEFHQADALEYLAEHGHEFDVIHASPPCQAYSRMSNARPGVADRYPRLIEPVRDLLAAMRRPSVIENVPGAPLRDPVVLCGTMFEGLRVYRHRLFEIANSERIVAPSRRCRHPVVMPRAGRYHPDGWVSVAGKMRTKPAADAMAIDWMTGPELSEAIPPAYTRWIGECLLGLHPAPIMKETQPDPNNGQIGLWPAEVAMA